MPILAAELLGQVGMGILMKAIPQINVFSINIELKVLIGLILLLLLISPFSEFLLQTEMTMLDSLRAVSYTHLILDTVSEMLSNAAESIDEVRVLGHTAQANPKRPNNVETDRTLASQRATNVVIYVQEHSEVDPARLVSEGIGQWRPVATNDTVEGRAQNRRVEMIVSGRDLEQELQGGILQYTTE